MIEENGLKTVFGSLFHDIGKVIYRSGGSRKSHSESGYEYLKEAGIQDEKILNCVRYHHNEPLKNAPIKDNDYAYIVYYADNIASFTDRREVDTGEAKFGFDQKIPLDSVFNLLNGNHGKSHYEMRVLNPESDINYPTNQPVEMDKEFYQRIITAITESLKGITLSEEYLNSLLSVLEANLSYIPSSTAKKEVADISLYDHVKITAAVASCVQQYLEEKQEHDFKKCLLRNAKKSYEEEMFLMYSMDISGIQKFIYTVGQKGALKGLRARSFYLEIMMEHIVDELLERLSLSRANLIYTGGGHCYMLIPNTTKVHKVIEEYESELNQWFMKTFDIALYVAGGYATATANNLKNEPEGSYSELYRTMSRMISKKKLHRYSADMIRKLNKKKHDAERECSVCHRSAKLVDEKCPVCLALETLSGSVLHEKYFTILSEPKKNAVVLPFGKYLIAQNETELLKHMQEISYVRCYTKNNICVGKHVTTKLWVGDYNTGETFEELAKQAEGVKRVGILRADVDSLGTAFTHGFQGEDGKGKYATLSRTATLSRQLSLFFKCYINRILQNGTETLLGKGGARKAVIIYSGGDDIFLAGAWNDVIAAFMDIRKALEKFTQGTLTISGGVGVYPPKYPVNIMAKEVERLEDFSKALDGKNAITLFEEERIYSESKQSEKIVENHRYSWDEFEQKVINEKLTALNEYFGNSEEHGMAFLYHLVELLRNTHEKINTARYVYLLSRMEPEEDKEKDNSKVRDEYRRFSEKMYQWSKNENDRKQLITAIYLYVYLNRREGEEDEINRG